MPIGRPSKYRAEFAEQVYKLSLLGATDEQAADFFGVDQSTLVRWRDTHDDFRKSTHAGKLAADAEIAQALYHRGRGYSHEAVKIFMPSGANEPVYASYTEHYPPDTAAGSLWLRNRQPALWRDKTDHEVTGKDGAALVPEQDLSKLAHVIWGIVHASKGQDEQD